MTGIVLKHRSSLQKSLCPVVICPYLCSSELSFVSRGLGASWKTVLGKSASFCYQPHWGRARLIMRRLGHLGAPPMQTKRKKKKNLGNLSSRLHGLHGPSWGMALVVGKLQLEVVHIAGDPLRSQRPSGKRKQQSFCPDRPDLSLLASGVSGAGHSGDWRMRTDTAGFRLVARLRKRTVCS